MALATRHHISQVVIIIIIVIIIVVIVIIIRIVIIVIIVIKIIIGIIITIIIVIINELNTGRNNMSRTEAHGTWRHDVPNSPTSTHTHHAAQWRVS